MTKAELCKIICDLTGWEKCNEMILRQINKYVTEHGWSYIEIARAFAYFVEVEGNKPDPQYGIAIVKFKMEAARKYYMELEKQKKKDQERIERAKELEEKPRPVIKMSEVNNNQIKLPLKDISKF